MKTRHHKNRPGVSTNAPAQVAGPAAPPARAAMSTDSPSPTGPNAALPPRQQPSPQAKPTLDMIRERAYFKWVEAGRPAGDGREFWERAEMELNGMSGEWANTGGTRNAGG